MVGTLIFLAVLGAALLLSWVLAERLRRPMDDSARSQAPGQFAELSQGRTHYRWDGAVRGPVIVCIHGLTTASYVWDPLVPRLALMGYRVLRYDLYGRGCSDRPEGIQDERFFLQQLDDLLAHQNLTGDITLLGYSMGGCIATAFAADESHRVARVMLLAPAGLGLEPGRFARLAAAWPGLGDWLMRVPGGWLMRRAARRAPQTEVTARQAAETRYAGYLPAVLSSLRHMLAQDMSPAHRRIAEKRVPLLAVWGEADETIPLSAVGRLAQLNRSARQETVPGAGHALPVTHPDEIHKAVQGFLRAG